MFFRSVCMAYAFLFFMRYLTMPGVFYRGRAFLRFVRMPQSI